MADPGDGRRRRGCLVSGKLLLSERETGFAAIAAVICLGATMGQQRERALELTGGVVVGC